MYSEREIFPPSWSSSNTYSEHVLKRRGVASRWRKDVSDERHRVELHSDILAGTLIRSRVKDLSTRRGFLVMIALPEADTRHEILKQARAWHMYRERERRGEEGGGEEGRG